MLIVYFSQIYTALNGRTMNGLKRNTVLSVLNVVVRAPRSAGTVSHASCMSVSYLCVDYECVLARRPACGRRGVPRVRRCVLHTAVLQVYAGFTVLAIVSRDERRAVLFRDSMWYFLGVVYAVAVVAIATLGVKAYVLLHRQSSHLDYCLVNPLGLDSPLPVTGTRMPCVSW